MDEEDQQALDNIEEYGCHVLNVMEGDERPALSCSIGIEKEQGKPELVIVGLKNQLVHSIINNYKNRFLQGETFVPGIYYSDFLEGFDVCLIEVDKNYYQEFFGWRRWLYDGVDLNILQLIWPTTDGVFQQHKLYSFYT